MAKIAEYVAPKTDLRPSNEGFAAFETAGRRVGSMYREAAQDQMTGAKLAGEMAFKDIEFPYLLQSLQSKGTASGGVSFKAVGGGSGSKDAFGAPRKMPNLSSENESAQKDLGISSPDHAATPSELAAQRPLQAFSGALGKLIDVGGAGGTYGNGDYGGGGSETVSTPASPNNYEWDSDYVSPTASPWVGTAPTYDYSGGNFGGEIGG